MLNYPGKYMRVSLSAGLSGIDSDKTILVTEYKSHPFKGDGHHLPIVDLMNGLIFYMSKDKPCYVEE